MKPSMKEQICMASSCKKLQPKYGSTSLSDQNCGVQPAERHTHTQTQADKSLKTEGPKILLFSLGL